MPDVRKYLVPDIDRALNYNFSTFGMSSSEELMEFLLLRNRKHVAAAIREEMGHYFPHHRPEPRSQEEEAALKREEKERFLRAVLMHASEVFKFPVLPRVRGESDDQYEERLKKFYTDEKLLEDLRIMRKFKILVSRTCNELGYESPEVLLLGRATKDEDGIKTVDFEDDGDVLEKFTTAAIAVAGRGDEYFCPFSYANVRQVQIHHRGDVSSGFAEPPRFITHIDLTPKDEDSDLSKENSRTRKNLLYYVMFFVAAVIGIGEGFAPAKFYLAQLLGFGVAAPYALAFAGFAFFAAFCVNMLLFRGDSFNTFRDLIFKNRFFKNSKGEYLGIGSILLNIFAVGLAIFSAATIAGLSFFFSGFGAIPAAFISLMTFIGFTGVLTYALMNVLQLKSVTRFFNYMKSLLWDPLVGIFAKGFSFKALLQGSVTFAVNAVSVLAMLVFGVSVVAATAAMFFGALSGIPLVAGAIGATGIAVVVGIAEIALGTFFALNVSKVIELLRTTILALPGKIFDFVSGLISAKQPASDSEYEEHPYRQAAVNTGRIATLVLVAFAFVNAGGYAAGYLLTASTHAAVVSVLGLGMFVPVFLLLAAPVIAAVAYALASIGGNATAAAKEVSAPDALHTYREDYVEQMAEKYQPAAPAAGVCPPPSAPRECVSHSPQAARWREASGVPYGSAANDPFVGEEADRPSASALGSYAPH